MNLATTTRRVLALLAVLSMAGVAAASEDEAQAANVSYYKQIRPILQARCNGCHQPAKAKGEYVTTTFDQLLAGGESGDAAIVAGKPDDSYLLYLITPEDDEAEMPKGKTPLSAEQRALVTRWIAEGAVDDTPESARVHFDAEHPPTYSGPPVIAAIDFSPDGNLLAVAGYYEVLLHKADGSQLVGRLVGDSERIESVRFSPDGKWLAVTGGKPGESGEVQIWDVAAKTLAHSIPVTFDVVYGASWSSDAKKLAFGCADKTVRAILVETGEQVLYQGAHQDRVLDTVFSSDDSHVVSVSQDQSVKLTEVATQRFIDNVTSITPGALHGGVNAVARHPHADAILVGGADGEPKLYHIFRHTKRVIGDDANLIRRFPALRGRVFGVAITTDGQWAAACSSLDGAGQVRVYKFTFEMEMPADIQKISEKRVKDRTPADLKRLAEYATNSVEQVSEFNTPQAGLYAVAFRPDGQSLAVAGLDGKIRLIDPATGTLVKEFVPVPLLPAVTAESSGPPIEQLVRPSEPVETESLAEGETIAAIEVQPTSITIDRPFDTAQFLVTGRLTSGDRLDVTRIVQTTLSGDAVAISPSGLVTVRHDGRAEVTFKLGEQTATATIVASGVDGDFHPDFIRDVAPTISKLGCNTGTCHGANKGKGGLKLSLRGNDPLFDVRAYADELACRRVNLAAPENSLMLTKASAGVPHEGGRVTAPGEADYDVIRRWIADGAMLDLSSPRVVGIEIHPQDPIVQRIGARQQFRVLATYSDGCVRDVTAQAHVDSGNTEVATGNTAALMTTLRRGEAPILARFEGAYAGTTLMVMGDRTEFVWEAPPVHNFIDELVDAKLQRAKTLPSPLCSDAVFIRRVYLDLVGLPPTAEQVKAFLADPAGPRNKRDALIDRLVGSPDYVEHWTNKWADLLQVNRKYLGVEGATIFRQWIHDQVAANRPYDQFAHELLTASGSNRENPAASYFKIHREPGDAMETTTHLFLGLRFNCNKCHDHPFERWTQNQYYQMAAFFARVGLKADPASGDKKIGGTAVEGATPLYEIVFDKPDGEVKHDRTGETSNPTLPYGASDPASADDAAPRDDETPQTESGNEPTRRKQLANWLTSADNHYFALSFANRMWAYLMGLGLIEPMDDIRAGNPPTNAALLERLTEEFVTRKFDVQDLVRTICKSRTYQLSLETNRWNEDDGINYSHALAKRLPAEVLFDTIHRVTGSVPEVPGAKRGARAATFLDPAVNTPDGFLTAFGRPPRESACECERSTGVQFGPVMALVSGATVSDAISDPKNTISQLAETEMDDAQLVRELFLRFLSRPATDAEVAASLELFGSLPTAHQELASVLAKLEADRAPQIAEQQRRREEAIAEAQAELAAYEKQIAPREAELDRAQQEQTAKLETELRDYEATLPDGLAAWEAREEKVPQWSPIDPHDLSSTSATTLAKESDLSIVSTSSNGLGTYKIVAHTDTTGISAIRLEAMSDDRNPKKGPGRAPDGNFVLTEFEVLAAPKADSAKAAKVTLENPQADFSQANHAVATAIDGRMDAKDNGWAIVPKVGENHVAIFETCEPVGFDGGTTLTFLLHHKHSSGEHTLGRFRISVTTAADPILLDKLPDAVTAVLDVAASERSDEQHGTLLDFYRSIDGELKRHQQAVAASRQPRAVDPKLTPLRAKLAVAQQPVPVEPRLKQLRDDVALSAKQLENGRTTAVQDLAWALINSPAFLFNR